MMCVDCVVELILDSAAHCGAAAAEADRRGDEVAFDALSIAADAMYAIGGKDAGVLTASGHFFVDGWCPRAFIRAARVWDRLRRAKKRCTGAQCTGRRIGVAIAEKVATEGPPTCSGTSDEGGAT